VTAYLLDEHVLRDLRARRNANVRKWIATVDYSDMRLSVATLFDRQGPPTQARKRFRFAHWMQLAAHRARGRLSGS
jgi:hypothetical protein